jgi:hypothetical protein
VFFKEIVNGYNIGFFEEIIMGSYCQAILAVKSEDTILVTENKTQALTYTGNFPEITANINGELISRAAILKKKTEHLSISGHHLINFSKKR